MKRQENCGEIDNPSSLVDDCAGANSRRDSAEMNRMHWTIAGKVVLFGVIDPANGAGTRY
jgi:hypothetical protein